jgi:hypothetical protein
VHCVNSTTAVHIAIIKKKRRMAMIANDTLIRCGSKRRLIGQIGNNHLCGQKEKKKFF